MISTNGQYHECPITDSNCHVGFGDVNQMKPGYLSCDPGYMAACSTPLTSQCDLPCIVRPITSPFVLVAEYVNFYQAIQRCRDMGMVLASIHNQTEAEDVAGLCNQNTNSNGQCWIALIRDANETDFKWLDVTNSTLNDGTVFPYFFDVYAHPHIPLSQDEAACGLTSGEDVTWADADCHTKRSFICAEPQRSKANEPSINPKSSYDSHSSHNGGYKKWPTPYPTNPPCRSTDKQPSTSIPTASPSKSPTALRLTPRPTDKPTVVPTATAVVSTTNEPTSDPSYNPTAHPIPKGTITPRPSTTEEVVEGPVPTSAPTKRPTEKPTVGATAAGSTTNEPTSQPTSNPNTHEPSTNPTTSYNPTRAAAATEQPTTMTPTTNPSSNPTTVEPTTPDPTWNPTLTPTTLTPTTVDPTTSSPSTNVPTTIEPTLNPTTMELTSEPSANPTTATTMTPPSNPTTKEPSSNPSINPTVNPIPKATNTPQPGTKVPFDRVPIPTPDPSISSSYPTSVPTKRPNKDSHVLFWCIVGLCLFVIFAVIACFVLRKRRKIRKKIGNQKYEQVDYNGYNGSKQEKEPEIINIHETYALNAYDNQTYAESQVCEE